MAAPIGNNFSTGRPKGTPNKTTEQIKSFYAMILERQEDKFLDALNRLYETNPKAYIEALTKISNKFVPDLQRTELTGEDGEAFSPFQIIVPQAPKPNE